VAALAAEVHRVEALVGIAGQELLPLDGDAPLARRLERRVGVARARDELVELEGEEAPRWPRPTSPVRSRSGMLDTRSSVAQRRAALRRVVAARVVAEPASAASSSVRGARAPSAGRSSTR
jgi:hypothetical protein